MANEADAALVARVRAGDASAFADLYRAHAPAVAAAVRDRVRQPDTVADIVQEVFTRALECLDTLRGADRFRPWVLAIARNAAADEGRFRARVTELEEDDAAALPSREPGPDELAELGDLARLVRGCVAGLSRRDAVVVGLVSELGFRPDELAVALSVTPGAAKVIVHRARRRLRDALALELRVRRRGACPDLHALYDAGQLRVAARHARTCEECAGLGGNEVQIFDATARGPWASY